MHTAPHTSPCKTGMGICTSPSLRILAVDADPSMARFYQEALPSLGHRPCVVASGRQAIDLCRSDPPDLVITDIRLPDIDGLAAATAICQHHALPVIVVASADEGIGELSASPILAYLAKPIEPGELGPAIIVALRCFERLRALSEEADQLRVALEERKIIERAKGAVMRYCRVDEEEAFRRLRKYANDHNHRMIDVAQSVIESRKVFDDLEAANGSREHGTSRHPRQSDPVE